MTPTRVRNYALTGFGLVVLVGIAMTGAVDPSSDTVRALGSLAALMVGVGLVLQLSRMMRAVTRNAEEQIDARRKRPDDLPD